MNSEWMPVNPCEECPCKPCDVYGSCVLRNKFTCDIYAQKKLLGYLLTLGEFTCEPSLKGILKKMLKQLESQNG